MKTIKKTILLFSIFATLGVAAQNRILSQEYYEGTINKNIEILFYLKIYEDGCPRVHTDAIYKYNKNRDDNWILLTSTFSEEKQQYTFVELYNTGILLLKKGQNQLNGLWISPDAKTQLEVNLKKVQIDRKGIENLEDKLEQEFYESNDC